MRTETAPEHQQAGQKAGRTSAYLNAGRWICDCSDWPDCDGAIEYIPPAGTDLHRCNVCGRWARIDWPVSLAEIQNLMELRPVPNRNWYPAGHPRGVADELETGQTLEDLRKENRNHGIEVS